MSLTVLHGDCRVVIGTLEPASIDACVTDPPYDIGFMGKAWDKRSAATDPALWAEVLRVLKPGAHLLAFGGTRTFHRTVCAIEDAGFEVRDEIAWLYGNGFPKSHDVAKATGDDSWAGWGTALKPAMELICVARKPLIGTVAENVLQHGCGGLNIDACRIETTKNLNGGRYSDNKDETDGQTYGKGLNKRSVVDYAQPVGRWPANVIHDGSDEVLALFPESKGQQGAVTGNEPSSVTNAIYGKFKSKGQQGAVTGNEPSSVTNAIYGKFNGRPAAQPRGDTGSAARFFYCSKASDADRAGSGHPTVKPLDLMRYLCRLVMPPGGVVLDPFAGSGTTGEAAMLEGFGAVLIEREAEYVADIKRRLGRASGDDLPLFAG